MPTKTTMMHTSHSRARRERACKGRTMIVEPCEPRCVVVFAFCLIQTILSSGREGLCRVIVIER